MLSLKGQRNPLVGIIDALHNTYRTINLFRAHLALEVEVHALTAYDRFRLTRTKPCALRMYVCHIFVYVYAYYAKKTFPPSSASLSSGLQGL